MQLVSVLMKWWGWGLEGKNVMCLNLIAADCTGLCRVYYAELCVQLVTVGKRKKIFLQ